MARLWRDTSLMFVIFQGPRTRASGHNHKTPPLVNFLCSFQLFCGDAICGVQRPPQSPCAASHIKCMKTTGKWPVAAFCGQWPEARVRGHSFNFIRLQCITKYKCTTKTARLSLQLYVTGKVCNSLILWNTQVFYTIPGSIWKIIKCFKYRKRFHTLRRYFMQNLGIIQNAIMKSGKV